jgi:hypothetical protein
MGIHLSQAYGATVVMEPMSELALFVSSAVHTEIEDETRRRPMEGYREKRPRLPALSLAAR